MAAGIDRLHDGAHHHQLPGAGFVAGDTAGQRAILIQQGHGRRGVDRAAVGEIGRRGALDAADRRREGVGPVAEGVAPRFRLPGREAEQRGKLVVVQRLADGGDFVQRPEGERAQPGLAPQPEAPQALLGGHVAFDPREHLRQPRGRRFGMQQTEQRGQVDDQPLGGLGAALQQLEKRQRIVAENQPGRRRDPGREDSHAQFTVGSCGYPDRLRLPGWRGNGRGGGGFGGHDGWSIGAGGDNQVAYRKPVR